MKKSKIFEDLKVPDIKSIHALNDMVYLKKLNILSSQRNYRWSISKKFSQKQLETGIDESGLGNAAISFLNWLQDPYLTFNGITFIKCESPVHYSPISPIVEIGVPRKFDHISYDQDMYFICDAGHRVQTLYTAFNGYFILPCGKELYFYYNLYNGQFTNSIYYNKNTEIKKNSIKMPDFHSTIVEYIEQQEYIDMFVNNPCTFDNTNTIDDIYLNIKDKYSYLNNKNEDFYKENLQKLLKSYYSPRPAGFWGKNIPIAKDLDDANKIFLVQNLSGKISNADRAFSLITTNYDVREFQTWVCDLLKNKYSLFTLKDSTDCEEQEKIIMLFICYTLYNNKDGRRIEAMSKLISSKYMLTDSKIFNRKNWEIFEKSFLDVGIRFINKFDRIHTSFLFNNKFKGFGINIKSFMILLEMINPSSFDKDFQKLWICHLRYTVNQSPNSEGHYINLYNYFSEHFNNKNNKKSKKLTYKNLINKLIDMKNIDINNLNVFQFDNIENEIAIEIILGFRKTPDVLLNNDNNKFNIDHAILANSTKFKKFLIKNCSGNKLIIPDIINKNKGNKPFNIFYKKYNININDFFNNVHVNNSNEYFENNPEIIVNELNYQLYNHKNDYIINELGLKLNEPKNEKQIKILNNINKRRN